MAIRDNTSGQTFTLVIFEFILSNTDTPSDIINTADFDMGVMFVSSLATYTDGLYTLSIGESDDSGMAGATVVGPEKIIGSLPILDVQISTSEPWKVFGVHSTKSFLQIIVTSSDIGVGGGAAIEVGVIMKSEYPPISRV